MKFVVEYTELEKSLPRLFKGKKRAINAKRNPKSMRIGTEGEDQVFFEFLEQVYSVEAIVEEGGLIVLSSKLFEKVFSVIKKEKTEFEARDKKLRIKQGSVELTIPYIAQKDGINHNALSLRKNKAEIAEEIKQLTRQIARLRKKALLENVNIEQDEDYKERFIHDKYIYYRRLIKEQEKRLKAVNEKLKPHKEN